MSKPMRVTAALLLGAIAFRSVVRTNFWWDHGNPVFALSNGIGAFITGWLAIGYLMSVVYSESSDRSKDTFMARFVSSESPVMPTLVGLILCAAGAYGMLVLVTEENFYVDWGFFGALLAAGIYILRRTFSVGE